MAAIPKFSRRGRWVVPAGVVTAVAAVGIASAITVAQAAPALPPRTPAQLLAAVAGDHSAVPPLTGTVVETAALGIPQLPGSREPELDHVAAGRVAHAEDLVRRADGSCASRSRCPWARPT